MSQSLYSFLVTRCQVLGGIVFFGFLDGWHLHKFWVECIVIFLTKVVTIVAFVLTELTVQHTTKLIVVLLY